MIKSIEVVNYLGESLMIELGRPGSSGLLIKMIEGLQPYRANINTTKFAPTTRLSGGEAYNSASIEKRNIVIDIQFDDYIETIETIRQKTYRYFPVGRFLTLYILTDNRYVKIDGYVEFNEAIIFSKSCGTRISIICPNPYFYSASTNSIVNTTFSGIESSFIFPFSNASLTEKELIFGVIYAKTENTITYTGDVETGLIVHMHALGPIENIKIYNTQTRELMGVNTNLLVALIGSGIIAGDDIIINTSLGFKSITLIRDGIYYNILNAKEGVDWLTLVKGDNLFAFTADSGLSFVQLRIENLIVYEGV